MLKGYIKWLASVFILLASSGAAAQTGSLYGVVYDEKTGDQIPGANILLVETTIGATTDLDGRYEIKDIPPDQYNMRITCMNYNPKLIEGIRIKSGERIKLNTSLLPVDASDAYRIEDVVVSAEKVLSTDIAILAERKKAATIGDAISLEQISRSPDATTGDALKRVTGLSVKDNKFVYVRGMPERYSVTNLDGVPISSTETDVDKKSFSFDLIPASFLENVTVQKTATPDMPGDFSGGLVQINTLVFPNRRQYSISPSASYEEGTTGEDMLLSQSGDRDWLGYDDGTRALPDGVLPLQPEDYSRNHNDLVRELPNNWCPTENTAGYNSSFKAHYGDHFNFGSNEFGVIAAGGYSNSYNVSEFEDIPVFNPSEIGRAHFKGTKYVKSVNLGGILGLDYRPSGQHKFSLLNLYRRLADDQVRISAGRPDRGSDYQEIQEIEWQERSILQSQLRGEHKFDSLNGLEIDWTGFYSDSDAEEPDRKQVGYMEQPSGAMVEHGNHRTWYQMKGDMSGARLDLTYPWREARFKTGFFTANRSREFAIADFYADPCVGRDCEHELTLLPICEVFDPDNFGPRKFTFILSTPYTGNYDGESRVTAGYLMFDYPFRLFNRQFRAIGGARLEDAEVTVNTVESVEDKIPLVTSIKKTDLLPSLNLKCELFRDSNLRLAYYKSLNYPEFREMANVRYYDFDAWRLVQGNPNLTRAVIDNYDVRMEWFPQIGDLLALSYFYKVLENPIEQKVSEGSTPYISSWFQRIGGKPGEAANYGFEVEIRKNLGFFSEAFSNFNTDYFENFTVLGNYSRVWSKIDVLREVGTRIVEDSRPLQGQAPWTINLGLMFEEPHINTSFSVLYNKIGRRTATIGVDEDRKRDIWLEPTDMLDMAIKHKTFFLDNMEIKFTVRNILDEDEILTFGRDPSDRPGREDFLHKSYSEGTRYSLHLTYEY